MREKFKILIETCVAELLSNKSSHNPSDLSRDPLEGATSGTIGLNYQTSLYKFVKTRSTDHYFSINSPVLIIY